jgi:hypothetical protein
MELASVAAVHLRPGDDDRRSQEGRVMSLVFHGQQIVIGDEARADTRVLWHVLKKNSFVEIKLNHINKN